MTARTLLPLAMLTLALAAGARPAQSQLPSPGTASALATPAALPLGLGSATGLFLLGQIQPPGGSFTSAPFSTAQQSQGGFTPGARSGILPPGGYAQIAANCIDLFYTTPDHRTRLAAAPDAGAVQLADGSVVSLQEAVQQNLVAVTGRHPDDRSPRHPVLLQFVLSNTSATPLRYSVRAGATFTPLGRAAGPVDQLQGLLRVRGVERHFGTHLMAYAVWAARGKTRDDVEQTLMTALPDKEARHVQQVLDDAGVREEFDREAGSYDRLYEGIAAGLRDAEEVQGHTLLGGRTPARIEALRGKDGRGMVTIRPVKRPGVFHYSAIFKPAPGGRIEASLHHLKSGFPIEANGGKITIAGRAANPDREGGAAPVSRTGLRGTRGGPALTLGVLVRPGKPRWANR